MVPPGVRRVRVGCAGEDGLPKFDKSKQVNVNFWYRYRHTYIGRSVNQQIYYQFSCMTDTSIGRYKGLYIGTPVSTGNSAICIAYVWYKNFKNLFCIKVISWCSLYVIIGSGLYCIVFIGKLYIYDLLQNAM